VDELCSLAGVKDLDQEKILYSVGDDHFTVEKSLAESYHALIYDHWWDTVLKRRFIAPDFPFTIQPVAMALVMVVANPALEYWHYVVGGEYPGGRGSCTPLPELH